MNERELKQKIASNLINYDLETLENWLLKYHRNLYKLGLDRESKEKLSMIFLVNDFLNIRNESILRNFCESLQTDEKLKSIRFDLETLEKVVQQVYTDSIEGEIEKLEPVKTRTLDFEGMVIDIEELKDNFSICMGSQTGDDLRLVTNENFVTTQLGLPVYGYLGFRQNVITGMSNKETIDDESRYDEFHSVVNSTRNGANSIRITGIHPSYVIAIDEITELDKKAAKDKNISILFIDRKKLAISESDKLDKMQEEFFRTFNPEVLRKMITKYFNNRNSFNDRKDLRDEYFDSLEMQVRLDVIVDELESCFGTKAERRAKLCLQYIYAQLEKEEDFMSEETKASEEEMNIKFLKSRIENTLGRHQNKLIEKTVNQAVQEIESMGELSETEKAYYMYLKLGSVLKHDPTYTLEGNRQERAIIYQYDIDENGYGICKSIVEEYQKALKRLGIDSEITEVVPRGKATHKDLVIKTKDGKNIFTNLIGDLSNIQNGKKIRNFGSGKRKIESVEIFGREYYRRISNEVGELTVISEEELEKMDEKFNHSYKGLYTNDMFNMLRKEIKDKAFLTDFFGTKDEDELLVKTFEFLMDKVGIVNSYNIENMGFYEATRYYDRLVGTTFSEDEKRHFRAFSDMYTRDENGNKKPGCVVVLNVKLPNSSTGKKENVNLYYEYNEDDKKFHKVEVEDVIRKNYISLQTRKEGKEFNEIINEMEFESGVRNRLGNKIGQAPIPTSTGEFDYID